MSKSKSQLQLYSMYFTLGLRLKNSSHLGREIDLKARNMLALISSALPPLVFYFTHWSKFYDISSIPMEWSAIHFWHYLLRVTIRLQSLTGSVQDNSTLTSDTSHTSGGLEVTCASNQLATNLGGSNNFFMFDNLLNWSTEVKKVFTYNHSSFIKDATLDHANE